METTYFANPETNLMYKRVSPTVVILLQVQGRDLNQDFHHKHEKVTFPSVERLEKDIQEMKIRTAQDWEDLMNEFLQVNKVKLELMNIHRQQKYERGELKV